MFTGHVTDESSLRCSLIDFSIARSTSSVLSTFFAGALSPHPGRPASRQAAARTDAIGLLLTALDPCISVLTGVRVARDRIQPGIGVVPWAARGCALSPSQPQRWECCFRSTRVR